MKTLTLTLHFGPIWWPLGITIIWLICCLISALLPRRSNGWFPDISGFDIIACFGGAFFVAASWATYAISLLFT